MVKIGITLFPQTSLVSLKGPSLSTQHAFSVWDCYSGQNGVITNGRKESSDHKSEERTWDALWRSLSQRVLSSLFWYFANLLVKMIKINVLKFWSCNISKLSFCEINSELPLKFNWKKKKKYTNQELNEICNSVQSIEKKAILKESLDKYAHFWRSYYKPDFPYL